MGAEKLWQLSSHATVSQDQKVIVAAQVPKQGDQPSDFQIEQDKRLGGKKIKRWAGFSSLGEPGWGFLWGI